MGITAAGILTVSGQAHSPAGQLGRLLGASPFKIVHESYLDHNWDLIVMKADGSAPVNLTRTPHENELYPQVSRDGTKICFECDQGQGSNVVRSVYWMSLDGGRRQKVADHARQPFWSPDGKAIGYLPQEYPKFNAMDYYTKGLCNYDLDSGQTRAHPNSANLHHLYNPNFSPDGKWIVSTVHAGMGYDHAIILIEANGDRVFNLGIPGCRPCLSPDGRQIAWGAGDHEIAVAEIRLDADPPKVVTPWRLRIKDEANKIYHVDWSPDGRYLSFSRGPDGEGDPEMPGTYQAACEIGGVYAPGWDICAVPADRNGIIDLATASEDDFVRLTANGLSNKEPAWFRAGLSGPAAP